MSDLPEQVIRRFFYDGIHLQEDSAGCFVLWQDHEDALAGKRQLENDLLCAQSSIKTLMLEVDRLTLLLQHRASRVIAEREE